MSQTACCSGFAGPRRPTALSFSTLQLLKGLCHPSTAQQKCIKAAQDQCDDRAIAFSWKPEPGEQEAGGTAWVSLGPAGFISSGSMLALSDGRLL